MVPPYVVTCGTASAPAAPFTFASEHLFRLPIRVTYMLHAPNLENGGPPEIAPIKRHFLFFARIVDGLARSEPGPPPHVSEKLAEGHLMDHAQPRRLILSH